jgi:hypothetical protein
MHSKRFLIGLLLLLVGACASAGLGNPEATSAGGIADTMTDAIKTYQALEPRLSAAQKEEFKDAYNHVCSAYQTAGTLLTAIFDAYDEASAHTALVSYQMTMEQLPILANRVSQLVQSFKAGAK